MKETAKITTCLLPLSLRHQLEQEAKKIGRGGITQLIIEGLHLRLNSEAGKVFEEMTNALHENTKALLEHSDNSSRIGGNLNQIAYWLNKTGGVFDPQAFQEISKIQAELRDDFEALWSLLEAALHARKR